MTEFCCCKTRDKVENSLLHIIRDKFRVNPGLLCRTVLSAVVFRCSKNVAKDFDMNTSIVIL